MGCLKPWTERVLFDHGEPRVLEELIAGVLTDHELRREILQSQWRRIAEIEERDVWADYRSLLT